MQFRRTIVICAAVMAVTLCGSFNASMAASNSSISLQVGHHDIGAAPPDRFPELAFSLRDLIVGAKPWDQAAAVAPTPSADRPRVSPIAYRVHVSMRSPEGLGYCKRV